MKYWLKCLASVLSLIPLQLSAQTLLKFDKRFVESEDHWVAFQREKDTTYSFGFIYIDSQAGLTFNYEGNFKITDAGAFLPVRKLDNAGLKIRLEPNQVRVAFIPDTKFKELNIAAVPEWLKTYKTDTGSVGRLVRWGFLYNSWGECKKALTYLEKGQKIDSKCKGLEFELAYAYNALEQYDKAIPVLRSALITSPDNGFLYKELSFAEAHTGQLTQAAETCEKGIPLCSDKAIKSEMAYNIAYEYYLARDKKNFKYWASKAKKWAAKGDQVMIQIKKMEADIRN